MSKMPEDGKVEYKKTPQNPSDFVVDVPSAILNKRNKNQYSREFVIGSGSYGKCYEVVLKSTGKRFACKVFNRKLLVQHDELKHMAENEIKIHRHLHHKHIVTFIESFDDMKHVYMILSLCNNGSLERLNIKRGAISIDECRYFVHQILHGVSYIHERGFIHRDLKLGNVLLDDNVQVKICDFGLATRINDAHSSRMICGTRSYMSPEIYNRPGFVPQSDIWAVGVVAFMLAFNCTPFQQYYSFEKFERILKESQNVDNDFECFLRATFQKDATIRPTADQCLDLDFFTKHNIPDHLPLEILTNEPSTQSIYFIPSSFLDNVSLVTFDDKLLDYPQINIKTESTLYPEMQAVEGFYILKRILQQLNDICRQNLDENDGNDMAVECLEPDYWISKWSHNATTGFAWLISDGTFGVSYPEGRQIKYTPNKVFWISENRNKPFRKFDIEHANQTLQMDLQQFHALKNHIKTFWTMVPETQYSENESPHLLTWFQTDKAMVLLLSDFTFQINFAKSHKKMLIRPKKNTMTYVSGNIIRSNFNTIDLKYLASAPFLHFNFDLLKYTTAALDHLVKRWYLKNQS